MTTRHEIPFARVTWREGAETRIVEIGAHCYDSAWPWWRPHPPWIPLERGMTVKKKKGPRDATFAKQPRRPRAPFVDPRGTLEQRVDQLSDRLRKLELAFELTILTDDKPDETTPASETK